MQLRNLDDHSPLPGITIGDIGVKFGNGAYNTMDNGFLMFDKFCIPRDQMLMRFSSLLPCVNKHLVYLYKETDSCFCIFCLLSGCQR